MDLSIRLYMLAAERVADDCRQLARTIPLRELEALSDGLFMEVVMVVICLWHTVNGE
ncbi:hypothetical protein [Yersinia intermedia]|uniref:hypothetical protein n=1 Tax=Yersinia intermedia TaxID=631 RepID=UPI00384A489B